MLMFERNSFEIGIWERQRKLLDHWRRRWIY